jgi:DNA adenine methylase
MSRAPLKSAGGKSWLAPEILRRFTASGRTNFAEPAVGGGAVSVHIAETLGQREEGKLWLNDLNPAVYLVWRGIKECPLEMRDSLRKAKAEFDSTTDEGRQRYFDRTRLDSNVLFDCEYAPGDDVSHAAARSWFLNHTVFNGLWRCNRKGHLNSPFNKTKKLQEPPDFAQLRRDLNNAFPDGVTVTKENFFDIRFGLPFDRSWFVYVDPPYLSADGKGHTKYLKDGFGEQDMRALLTLFEQWCSQGAYVALSSSDLPVVRDMFSGWHIHEHETRWNISAKASTRGDVKELLITTE